MGDLVLRSFTPDDGSALSAFVAVRNAALALDAPQIAVLTPAQAAGELAYGWSLEPSAGFLARLDPGGPVVAAATYQVERFDNLHLCTVEVIVHPDHRRQGYGSTILEALAARGRAEEKTVLLALGWDTEAARGFATRHGLRGGSVETVRRQLLGEVDRDEVRRRHAELSERAAAYELLRMGPRTPEDHLAEMAAMATWINDAPTDDLEVEDDLYTPDRVRAYERAQELRGMRVRRVLVRHRPSGELAGQTVVAVDGERPWLAEQHDTTVIPAHRGHRLGLLLKLEMLLWLLDSAPEVEWLDTWNAASNDHMIAVNEELGYRVVAHHVTFQRPLR